MYILFFFFFLFQLFPRIYFVVVCALHYSVFMRSMRATWHSYFCISSIQSFYSLNFNALLSFSFFFLNSTIISTCTIVHVYTKQINRKTFLFFF